VIITKLKQQVKNPERANVFVDGKYSFSLSFDELISQKVKQGDELDQAKLKKLQKISSDGKLRARALAWLMNRPHSTRELKDYLIRKKAEPELIEKFTKDFTGRGYLNDNKYAMWLVELRGRSGKSNRALRAELYKKGIGREVTSEVLDNTVDEAERLKIMIAKKQKLTRYKNDELKLTKYLTSQGFSYSSVKQALGSGGSLD
jgi:regulatory protein